MTEKKFTVLADGEKIGFNEPSLLSEIISGEKPCGGHGRCGKCKLVARGALSEPTADERRLLTEEELERGVRLACLTYALGDCEVESLAKEKGARILADGALPSTELHPRFRSYGVALDIGTTTLAARLYGKQGEQLSSTARMNPQGKWGADVISRIEESMGGGAHRLAMAIREAVSDMIIELAKGAKVDTGAIDGAVITGNTVMLSLLTEESVEPFSHAPFDVKRLFGESLLAAELGLDCLPPDTEIYLPPCISAFVGADTTCAILGAELDLAGTAMLADIGTNGEMALWHNGRLTVCSTAAGPAFEGVGISMGMRGADGAIDRVSAERGELRCRVIGGGDATGICGSGLVDAAAAMLELDIIDESGYLEEDEFPLLPPVTLTPRDIRMLQLAKSAICAGIMTLAESEGLTPAHISRLFIAGGFGNYLNKESAAKIGLLPRELAKKSLAVGNAALTGASMLLLNKGLADKARRLAENALYLELSGNRTFARKYTSGMILCEVTEDSKFL